MGAEEKQMDRKLKKTVLITVAVLILFFSAVILLVWFNVEHELPLWLLFVLLLAPAAVLIGTVAVFLRKLGSCWERK